MRIQGYWYQLVSITHRENRRGVVKLFRFASAEQCLLHLSQWNKQEHWTYSPLPTDGRIPTDTSLEVNEVFTIIT